MHTGHIGWHPIAHRGAAVSPPHVAHTIPIAAHTQLSVAMPLGTEIVCVRQLCAPTHTCANPSHEKGEATATEAPHAPVLTATRRFTHRCGLMVHHAWRFRNRRTRQGFLPTTVQQIDARVHAIGLLVGGNVVDGQASVRPDRGKASVRPDRGNRKLAVALL